MDVYEHDLICSQEWSRGELNAVLDLAGKMKLSRFSRTTWG